MLKKITCIECPQGCPLSVDVENCKVVKVSGNKCPKGLIYAAAELENPARILTSIVSAEGLELKMIPVRTTKPIPKGKLLAASEFIKTIKVRRPVRVGDIVVNNLIGLGADLIATRDVSALSLS